MLYVRALSFGFTAYRQENKWVQEKKDKRNEEDFLRSGPWRKSRHPFYLAESCSWIGLATIAAGVLASSSGNLGMGLTGGFTAKAVGLLMAGVSPAFLTFLLFKVSGIPLSENKYGKEYCHREDYKKWKRETPMFPPKFQWLLVTNRAFWLVWHEENEYEERYGHRGDYKRWKRETPLLFPTV